MSAVGLASAYPSRAMRNVRVLCSYNGAEFFGFQRQDGFETVQEALEDAVSAVCRERVVVHGSGRTDRGVHAIGQVASFHCESTIPDNRLRHALNFHLPDSLIVRRLETCADDFHPRFHAVWKRYVYLTLTSRFRLPIGHDFAHWTRLTLDRDAMERAAKLLEGRHDFAAFGNASKSRRTTTRLVRRVRLVARRDRFLIVVDGNGFLYNMVRTIAGTLIKVGQGQMAVEQVAKALETGVRTDAGPTAPANGLYLMRVVYPEPTFVGLDPGPRGQPGLIVS
ncbi:MAG: tRNA pseudouridine38-40 synthase [Planctomycetota bacterium]|jgi:tRNA pseudouridine38-40 synthase